MGLAWRDYGTAGVIALSHALLLRVIKSIIHNAKIFDELVRTFGEAALVLPTQERIALFLVACAAGGTVTGTMGSHRQNS